MKLLGAGDNVVDRYRHLGTYYPGGNAVNVAVFAGRLGANTSYMGVLGDDESGRHVLASLRQEGVDTSLITVAKGPNAYADVDVIDNDRVFVGSNRGVSPFEPDQAQLTAMEGFDVVHTGYAGYLLPHIPEIAQRTRVSYDFANRYEPDSIADNVKHLYLASYSASHLDERGARDLVRSAIDAGATYALATRGGDGAFLASADDLVYQEADRVVVRDTLGAGDAFISSVLVGLLTGRELRTTMASASAHAAQVCLDHGAFGHGAPFDPNDETFRLPASTLPETKVTNQ